MVLTLCRNVDFVNFLIAVLPQGCAACKKRMHSQSLKTQFRMIPTHDRTLQQEAFEDSSLTGCASGGGARDLADQAALYRKRRLHILH